MLKETVNGGVTDKMYECFDTCNAATFLTNAGFCINSDYCSLFFGKLKDGTQCSSSCVDITLYGPQGYPIECVSACPGTHTTVGNKCFLNTHKSSDNNKAVKGTQEVEVTACNAGSVVIFQDLKDRTTINECITLEACQLKGFFIKGNTCVQKCESNIFAKLDSSKANDKLLLYCGTESCSELGFHYLFEDTEYCIKNDSNFSGYYIDWYSDALNVLNDYQLSIRKVNGNFCETHDTSFKYKFKDFPKGEIEVCLDFARCQTTENPNKATILFDRTTKRCYKNFTEYTTAGGAKIFVNSLTNEIVNYDLCVNHGLFLNVETKTCQSTCADNILNIKVADAVKGNGLVSDEWMKLCVKPLDVASNLSAVNNLIDQMGYTTVATIVKVNCDLTQPKTMYFSFRTDSDDYYIDNSFTNTENTNIPANCSSYNVRPIANCTNPNKLVVNFIGSRRVANTCLPSANNFINYKGVADYLVTPVICPNFGILVHKVVGNSVEQTCEIYTAAAFPSADFSLMNGKAIQKSLCIFDNTDAALYFYKRINETGSIECVLPKSEYNNYYWIPNMVGTNVSGFVATTNKFECTQINNHGLLDRTCVSAAFCLTKGKHLEKTTEGNSTVFVCKECSAGLYFDKTDGICRSLCNKDQILVKSTTTNHECLDPPTVTSVSNDVLKLFKLSKDKFIDTTKVCAGSSLGYSLVEKTKDGKINKFKAYFCEDNTTCITNANNVGIVSGGVNFCIPLVECDRLKDYGIHDKMCKQQTSTLFFDVNVNTYLITANECNAKNEFTHTTEAGRNECINRDECLALNKYPSSNGTCSSTCANFHEFYVEGDVKKIYCNTTCPVGYSSYTDTSDGKKVCTKKQNCLYLGNFWLSLDGVDHCKQTFAEIKALSIDVICNMTSRICDKFASAEILCDPTWIIIKSEQKCVKYYEISEFNDIHLFFNKNGNRNHAKTLTECLAEFNSIDFDRKECGNNLTMPCSSEGFAKSTIDGKNYCINKYYCTLTTGRGVSSFWNTATKQCLKSCKEVDKIALMDDLLKETRTCVTNNECYDLSYYVQTEVVAGEFVYNQCTKGCDKKTYQEFISLTDTRSIHVRNCFENCPTGYSVHNTQFCLKDEQCVFEGTSCNYKFGDDLGTKLFKYLSQYVGFQRS